jgi:FKBP-type peptidyl-prolyl cis-trans isomerase
MSEVTAVPLRPIKKSALVTLWLGIALAAAAGAAVAYVGTAKQVAMAQPASEFLARNAQKSGVVTTSSGLQYKVIEPGSGPTPQPSDMVVVDYEGKLANGESFDSSARHGGPATLPVGGLIPGWVEGLQLMRPGSKYRFWIPPELGYGPEGAGDGVIPPNALLVFDVALIAIAPQGQHGMGPQ